METRPRTKRIYRFRTLSVPLLIIVALNISSAHLSVADQATSNRDTELNDDDALRIDAKHFRFQFENRQIRVLRLTLQGGEFVPMHKSPDALLMCVSECHVRLQRPDKKIHDIHMDAGETRWIRASERSEKNLSDKLLGIVVVEIKQPAH